MHIHHPRPSDFPEEMRRENDALFTFFDEAAAESHDNPDWPPPVVVGVAGVIAKGQLDAMAAEFDGDREAAVAVLMAYAYAVGRKAERAGLANAGKAAVADIVGGPTEPTDERRM